MKTRVRKLYREDFFSFAAKALREAIEINIQHQLYLQIMSAQLTNVISGRSRRRLVINLPPRHLKTWLCICFAAYFLARNPKMEVLIVCHDEDLAKQITDRIRGILRAHWFQTVF